MMAATIPAVVAPKLTLRQKQSLFAKLIGQLIGFVYSMGWELTFGDVWRPDKKGHMPGSVHYIRLAADVNLFVGGIWKDRDCPEWQTIGRFWKGLDPLCAWGGDFRGDVDLNHFSLAHDGKK
jgi:hypothetical protein